MNEIFKKIRIKDSVADKFLSVDSNGNVVSTNYGNSDITDITNRLQTLEGTAEALGIKIVEINGETV